MCCSFVFSCFSYLASWASNCGRDFCETDVSSTNRRSTGGTLRHFVLVGKGAMGISSILTTLFCFVLFVHGGGRGRKWHSLDRGVYNILIPFGSFSLYCVRCQSFVSKKNLWGNLWSRVIFHLPLLITLDLYLSATESEISPYTISTQEQVVTLFVENQNRMGCKRAQLYHREYYFRIQICFDQRYFMGLLFVMPKFFDINSQ